ncbi:hypothetical protein DFR55_1262 [Herbinix hemicellulosilytica]|uniref:Zn-finger containing protein n=1 Tax=Herbinix hemicellulosilytica TaxID=1564487 RepID=A0A0H5SLT9_HERHM|nr:hypothetical protein [Herbinix hemicellulosilytica]RBP57234.1 hypothetical protein DFR55_1262 [Herbinix hemicellulosilytica]CRZ35761.1 hypothetical protein HHT355_2578 [Herbinix hemicellulosilytica]
MKDKLRRFMMGRYGIDDLGRFLLGMALIILLMSRFFLRTALYAVSLSVLIIVYYRIFSKNINSRYRENQAFLNYKNKLINFIRKQKYIFKQRRIYRIYKCPGCGQKIRIPKGKGRVQITCPKCKTDFIRKS